MTKRMRKKKRKLMLCPKSLGVTLRISSIILSKDTYLVCVKFVPFSPMFGEKKNHTGQEIALSHTHKVLMCHSLFLSLHLFLIPISVCRTHPVVRRIIAGKSEKKTDLLIHCSNRQSQQGHIEASIFCLAIKLYFHSSHIFSWVHSQSFVGSCSVQNHSIFLRHYFRGVVKYG